jgi:hypothetical protein
MFRKQTFDENPKKNPHGTSKGDFWRKMTKYEVCRHRADTRKEVKIVYTSKTGRDSRMI